MLIEKQGSYGSAILGHEDEWRYLVPGRWGKDALLGDMEKPMTKIHLFLRRDNGKCSRFTSTKVWDQYHGKKK
eukprot:gene2623-3036_t